MYVEILLVSSAQGFLLVGVWIYMYMYVYFLIPLTSVSHNFYILFIFTTNPTLIQQMFNKYNIYSYNL